MVSCVSDVFHGLTALCCFVKHNHAAFLELTYQSVPAFHCEVISYAQAGSIVVKHYGRHVIQLTWGRRSLTRRSSGRPLWKISGERSLGKDKEELGSEQMKVEDGNGSVC